MGVGGRTGRRLCFRAGLARRLDEFGWEDDAERVAERAQEAAGLRGGGGNFGEVRPGDDVFVLTADNGDRLVADGGGGGDGRG